MQNRPSLRLARRLALVVPVLALGLAACGSDDPVRPFVPPDTVAPSISLELRAQAADGLVRLRAVWSDAARPLVDPRLVITIDGQPLSPEWVRWDGDGTFVDLEESLDGLLPAGAHEVITTVTDSAGNRGSDTLRIDLPPLTPLGSIPAEVHSQGPLVACGDSAHVFLGVGAGVVAVDALHIIHELIAGPTGNTGYSGSEFVACAPDEGALYTANGLHRLDVAARTWSARKNDADGYALAQSMRRPDELFVGTSFGILSGYDRRSGQLLRQIRLPGSSPTAQNAIVTIAAAPGDERIFVTQYLDSTYVFDANWALISRLPYALNAIALTADGARGFGINSLYGVAELNPRTGAITGYTPLPGAWRIDVRPDGQVAFVSTVTPGGAGRSSLVDLRDGAFRELARVPGSGWYQGGAAWLPRLRRLVVFNGEEGGLDHFDVYLDRN